MTYSLIPFSDFMQQVEGVVSEYAEGLTSTDFADFADFADAAWFELYLETNGQADTHDIVETLAEADSLFQEMARCNGAYV